MEAEYDDGWNDRWDANEAYLGASPASPTSAQYMRRAAGGTRLGEGSRVRAVYEWDGEWYPGRIVRVFGGGAFGVQFDGYDDWERCTQVEAVESPRRPSRSSDQEHRDSPYAAPRAPSTAAAVAAANKKPWDQNIIDRGGERIPKINEIWMLGRIIND